MNSYRWIVLATFWLTYAGMGAAMSSMAPLVTPILSELKISYGEMGVILGSWQLAFIPFSLVAGIALDKWGIRKTLFAGGTIVALSVGLRYFANGFTTLLPMVALFGVGGPLIAGGTQLCQREYRPDCASEFRGIAQTWRYPVALRVHIV